MKRLTLALLSAAALAFGGAAVAQDKYPSKPVKIIVPYAPGGATDITSRLFGEQLKNILGQQFVVESKPGAFGILAIEEMARSRPDGYTLEESKTWLKSELDTWRKITSEVKIDLSN